MHDEAAEMEPEWDDADSGDYQDGREQGEADARDGRPPADCDGMSQARREGYLDGYKDVKHRARFRASLRGGSGG